MSQVTKLQGGGETTEKKIGSLTINGTRYDATPEMLGQLSSYLSGYGKDAATLSGVMSALQNGEDLVYDGVGNVLTGNLDQYSGLNERGNRKRDLNNASPWRKQWQAYFNTDAHQYRKALHLLNGWAPTKGNSDNTSGLENINGDSLWFDYDPTTGKYTPEGSSNLAIKRRLDTFNKYYGLEDPSKTYTLGSGFKADTIANAKSLWGDQDKWNARIADILAKAEKGSDQLTPDDLAFLKNFNIVKPDATAQAEAANATDAAEKSKWDAAGLGDLWDSLGATGIGTINDDGSISISPDADWLLKGYTGNIRFDDDFYKTPQGTDSRFAPYRNLTYLNGRLYTPTNEYLNKYLNASGGFNEKMKAGDWEGANSDIQFLFTDAAKQIPVLLGGENYSEYLSNNPSLRYKNLTGLVTTPGMNSNDQIVEIYNLADDTYDGFYRDYKPKYALLDQNGKLIKELNQTDISTITNGTSRGDLLTHKRVQGTGTEYDGMYYQDLFDSKGRPTNFRIFRSPKDNSYILHLPDGLRNGLFGSHRINKNIRIPKGLAEVLINNKSWTTKIFEDAQKQKDFENIISELIRRKGIRIGLEGSLRKLGFNDAEIAEFKNALQGSMQDRRYEYLVDDIQLQKQGGVIKQQFGGFTGGTTTAKGVTEQRLSQQSSNPQNATIIGSGKADKTWTDADTADVVALVSDLTSLGLALSPDPFTDIASVATGIGGSTARFYADSQRGTKGRGLNYLTSLGMDMVGLIPIIGGPMKTGSVVGKVKKALPTVLKGLALVGAPIEVANAAKNIANGNFTVRDLNMLVDALGGLEAVRRSGFKSGTKKTKGFQEMEIPGKKGTGQLDLTGKKFKFTEEELTPLLDKTPEEQQKVLNDLLLTKIRNETGNSSITLEQALNAVDQTNFNVESLISNPILGRKSSFDLSGENIKLTSEEVTSIANVKDKTKQAEALDNLIWDKVKTKLRNPNLSKEQALQMVDRSQFDKTVRNWKIGKSFLKKDVGFEFNPKKTEVSEEAIEASGNAFKDWWNGVGQFKTGPFGIGGKKVGRTEYNTFGSIKKGTGEVPVPVIRHQGARKVSYKNKTYDFTAEEVNKIVSSQDGWANIFKNKVKNTDVDWRDLWHAFANTKHTLGSIEPQKDISSIPVPEAFKIYTWGKLSNVPSTIGRGVAKKPYEWHQYAAPLLYKQRGMLPWLQLTGNEREPLEGSVMRPLYEKKGGKIVKAQNGIQTGMIFQPKNQQFQLGQTNFQLPTSSGVGVGMNIPGSSRFDWRTGQYVTDYVDLFGNTSTVPNSISYTSFSNPKPSSTVTTPTSTGTTSSSTTDTNATEKDDRKNRITGGWNEKAPNLDPTVPLNWARALYSMSRSNKQLKNFLARPMLQMQDPLTNAPRFIDTGERAAYYNAANKTRFFKPVTSNAIQNDLGVRSRQQTALQYELQGDLAASQGYGRYKQALDQYNNEVALRNTDIANKNRQLRWQYANENVQAKNANIAEKSKFFDQAAYATQDWMTQQMKLRNALRAKEELASKKLMAQREIDNEYKELIKNTKEDSEERATGMKNLQFKALNYQKNFAIDEAGYNLAWPYTLYAKSGGKISKSSGGKDSRVTYSRDPYPDLLLQNSKSVDKFVQKLNDNIIRLILKAEPLYVS